MSLFGQPSSGSSLFGQKIEQKPFSGGFGNSSQAAAQTQGSSLFGSNAAGTSNSLSGNTLFGSTLGKSQPQQSTSLFGSATPATMGNQQPQPTSNMAGAATTFESQQGGLFGSTLGTASSSQTQPSLFGTAASSAPPGNSLFSSINPPQPQQPNALGATISTQAPIGNSSFGNLGLNPNQNQQQPGASLFSGVSNNNNNQSSFLTSQNQQQTGSSLFGSTLRPGGLTMGQSMNQHQQQTVPGVKIDVSNIRGTTRFNDLHEELQKSIEQIDAFIQQQIAFKEQCEALMPNHERNLRTIPTDVEYVENQLETTQLALEGDIIANAVVKDLVKNDADNARLTFQAVENLKLPQQFHYSGMWQRGTPPRSGGADDTLDPKPADLLSFFNTTASTLFATLDNYQSSLTEIENYLGSVERQTVAQDRQMAFQRGRDGGPRGSEDQKRELFMVLKSFEAGVARTAERVGGVREDLSSLVEGNMGKALGNGR